MPWAGLWREVWPALAEGPRARECWAEARWWPLALLLGCAWPWACPLLWPLRGEAGVPPCGYACVGEVRWDRGCGWGWGRCCWRG